MREWLRDSDDQKCVLNQAMPRKYHPLHYNRLKCDCDSLSLVSKFLFQELLCPKHLVKGGSVQFRVCRAELQSFLSCFMKYYFPGSYLGLESCVHAGGMFVTMGYSYLQFVKS